MKYLRIENFLNQQENQKLLAWVVSNAQAFKQSTVTTGEANYRRSKVAYSCPLVDLVTNKVKILIPIITSALDLGVTDKFSLESQVTAHSDGDFFKIHTDKNDRDCLYRAISYVYYFHSLPKTMKHGELAFYSDREKSNRVLITPDNNTLVCFSSTTWHEVLPVAGKDVFDSCRFTINGWINSQLKFCFTTST